MYSITELKKGTLIQLEGTPYRVVDYAQKQMGRGGSIVSTKLKNLINGSVLNKTFKGNEKVEPAQVERLVAQFLYSDASGSHFMNTSTYDQLTLDPEATGDARSYLSEGLEANLLQFSGRIIGLELPPNLVFTVTEAEAGVKGDTATAALKNCIIETGLKVQVPMFINVGDKIKVDTRTGEYLERIT